MSAPDAEPPVHSASVPALKTPKDEGLPEDIPITPELLEDEAQRGDFMIRWSVVLLAFLLGCTEIADSQTLVHVKTGQYLLSHGILPPRTDVFSYTAEGRPWINLGWLFDLTLAGIYAVAGPIGLSLMKATLAATAFGFLVHTNLRNVSTWWNSIIAALALMVSHPQFVARPEIVTLVGVAALFWMLQRYEADLQRRLWALPAMFLIWSNLDPRMFVGLVFLLLYASGEAIGSALGHGSALTQERRRHLHGMVAASWAAALVNPFGWHAWLAPISLYGVEYPALRQYYSVVASPSDLQYRSLVSPLFWRLLDPSSISWLIVAASAAVSLLLNVRRLQWGHTFLFLGAVIIGTAGVREFPVTSIALTVVAALNAEAWYRQTFRQTYSASRSELVFSQGGRIITVVALVGVAFLAISGRLPSLGQIRVGVGWQPNFASQLSSLAEEMDEEYDDRPFNFMLQQGDQFIWLGQRAFIDHRVALYAGGRAEDLIQLHDSVRRSLRTKRSEDPLSGDRATWQKTFDRFQVSHVVPRLAGNNPDYRTLVDLMRSRDWQLSQLGSAAAIFYRSDRPDPKLSEFLDKQPLNFLKQAFRSDAEAPETVAREWPASSGAYESILLKRRTDVPAVIQEAQHYQVLIQESMTGRLRITAEYLAAFAHLVIRKANDGLAENPNSAQGFRLLGTAYDLLNSLEITLSSSQGGVAADLRRFYQTSFAFSQSLLLDPDQPLIHRRLAELYSGRGRLDLAVHHLDLAKASLERRGGAPPVDEASEKRYEELRAQLAEKVQKVRDELQTQAESSDPQQSLARVRTAFENGCVLLALEMVEQNPTMFDVDPSGQLFKAQLLLDAGRPWDAAPLLERLEQLEPHYNLQSMGLEWRSLAALTALARGHHTHGAVLWKDELQALSFEQLASATRSLPLIGAPQAWPFGQFRTADSLLYGFPRRTASIRFQSALTHLERGDRAETEAELRAILSENPETELRPLVRFYLANVSGEVVDLAPPSDRIPITSDLFAPEEPSPGQPADEPATAELPDGAGG